ncbi:hypothetical protein B9T19_07280 [Ignatzschineria sp. F8392]|uniref:hypothetical protein n=1 Tax=Ignatzschineria sp. F8392 TaxID=1980117 RepID=UPI000B982737|nr:hypothetical protein [Ignatzschineria sp. F8392]OYQ78646.1 hypothetical protein B9T19_07280 [Ignatzschineria sp. F8392]
MKRTFLTLSIALILGSAQLATAKMPALTTPSMSDQEYAETLGFELKKEDSESDKSASSEKEAPATVEAHQDNLKEQEQSAIVDNQNTNNAETEKENARPQIELKKLVYRCDISLSQPFPLKNPEKVELALGNLSNDEEMVIKLKNMPIKLERTHFEPEHLYIWSNTDNNVLMTLEVDEVYEDNFVKAQTGTLTILTPKLKEEYRAVHSCRR